ncbi:hypothetical protein [Mucilaginibacter boryungensis]|uniref:Uncharacterized protein n=1 Tax=Mucilaginibacter boryungensis TaxID=768480 RepID=A0ABR9XJU4_9SPHI|nr:hypothetical protein [Mucilaginibacter boryungensis]MBE9667273.1 hypothetical protein [Mucilaginibacter boryungensis]
MNNRIITLCYRKIIRPNSLQPWEKMVHEDSYMEFKMQAQNFSVGTQITSYAELLRQVPNAQQLPDRVAPSVSGYVQQLGGIIPDILNTLGRRFLRFNNFQFEIINSDISDSDKHVIAINFFSTPLLWIDTVDNYLLVSAYQEKIGTSADIEILTDLFQLQPYLNIHSLALPESL